MLNAFTVDVEDYYHVSAFERHIPRARWPQYESRVVANTDRILRLLERHSVRATFFILGWVAEQHADLVRRIDREGHEIGSHSYWHRLIYNLTPDEFRHDLRHSCDVLQQIIGRPITSYRAPSFSITERSRWALDILAEEGIEVDSSIYPIYHDRYGIPGARAEIHQIATASGAIWEFPPSVARLGGFKMPVSGGGYFRLYPALWSKYCLGQINKVGQRSFMFYIHPWEVDPYQPRMGVGSRLSRFRHYVNLHATEAKLGQLLHRFRFGRMCDVLAEHSAAESDFSAAKKF